MKYKTEFDYELGIIGAGLAGMAATLFAANRGISTFQCGNTSSLTFSSGLIDLLGIFPIAESNCWENPWKAIETLKNTEHNHPYSKSSPNEIKEGLSELLNFFAEIGFQYFHSENENQMVITAQGTVKPSYLIPISMQKSGVAYQEKASCLVVGFERMKEFSARQVVESLKADWSNIRYKKIEFPGLEDIGEVHPERMAQYLEVAKYRKKFASTLKPLLKEETYLGLPAILGLSNHKKILEELEADLMVGIFEIPTPAVSVSGLRVKELFEQNLPRKNVKQVLNSWVESVTPIDSGGFSLLVSNLGKKEQIKVKGLLLTTGRFLGKGLQANRTGIKEALFNLPVSQPAHRKEWLQKDFFSKNGNPINKAGLEVDEHFRPLGKDGKAVYDTLFSAGSILAHQDWIREKSGGGIAISSAFGAINSFSKMR